MAKPRKKYNHNLRLKRMSDFTAHNSCLVLIGYLLAIDGLEIIKNGRIVERKALYYEDVRFLFHTTRPWTVVFGVACRNQLGKGYISYDQDILANQFKFTDDVFQDYIYSQMQQAREKVNADHILSPFLMAFPEKRDVDEEYIQRIIRWKGVEKKLVTPFEFRNLEKEAQNLLLEINPNRYIDKTVWTTLNKNGINNLADMRKSPVHLSKLKGIGEKRLKHITDGYLKLLADHQNDPHFEPLIEYENQREIILLPHRLFDLSELKEELQ